MRPSHLRELDLTLGAPSACLTGIFVEWSTAEGKREQGPRLISGVGHSRGRIKASAGQAGSLTYLWSQVHSHCFKPSRLNWVRLEALCAHGYQQKRGEMFVRNYRCPLALAQRSRKQ